MTTLLSQLIFESHRRWWDWVSVPSMLIGRSALASLITLAWDDEGFGAFLATLSTRHITTMIDPASSVVSFTASHPQ